MKRIIMLSLLVLSLTTLANPAVAGCCGYSGGYYNGLMPGYYGNTYYGGGLIYYPNSDFFYRVGPTANPVYFYNGCGSGCCSGGCRYRVVKRYSNCKVVAAHRDRHGCWIPRHRICWR